MVSDDGLHEAWLAPVFHDGQRGSGVSGGTIPPNHIAVGSSMTTGTWDSPQRRADLGGAVAMTRHGGAS